MGKRILLADDSVTIHKVVELTFLDEDYEVEAVNNGAEAVARLDGERPDLVIADVHMPPGPSGYEVCDKVRETHPSVPVLLLAGAFEAFDEERAATADAFLKKPFDSQRLLQTVQELMAASSEAPEVIPTEAAPVVAEAPAALEEETGVAAPAVAEEVEAAVSEGGAGADLSESDIEAIARRVAELIGADVVREVAWEVVPDLAEVVVKDRLRELEEPAE
jgi:CheY-like chemotaxis protein